MQDLMIIRVLLVSIVEFKNDLRAGNFSFN